MLVGKLCLFLALFDHMGFVTGFVTSFGFFTGVSQNLGFVTKIYQPLGFVKRPVGFITYDWVLSQDLPQKVVKKTTKSYKSRNQFHKVKYPLVERRPAFLLLNHI